MSLLRTILCVLLFGALCYATKPHHKTRLGIHGQHYMHKTQTVSTPQYNPLFFTQTLDHFNGHTIVNWQQQYFVNDTFFRGGHDPVFLCVGGEGPPLDPTVVIDGGLHCGWMIILAEKHHALVLAIEHRFYGISIPTSDYSTKNLQFLSSEQALADIASFHTYISSMYKLDEHNKWFTFGGSYPGMLAGWARLKYPQLIHASVSSSAPVFAQANFQGYNDVVAASMSAPIVGGSTACAQQIQEAFQALGTALKDSDGRLTMAQQFNVCSADSLDLWNNQADFTEDISGIFGVQENDPSCTTFACNISSWCEVMQDETKGEPLDRLAYLFNYFAGDECLYLNHTDGIVQLQNTSLAVGQDRSWLYQTCAEFGFFQTCDPKTQCIFTSSPHYNTLQSSYDVCMAVFGISGNVTAQRIQFTNEQYGGNRPAGSRIVFVNGQIDPWHYLSVLHDLPHDEPAIWVEGASHHAWTHTPAPTDTPEVWAARYKIADYVAAWLVRD